MLIDPVIVRRLDDLLAAADAIKAAHTPEQFSHRTVYRVSEAKARGWAASALNLLQRVTGTESSHAVAFERALNSFGGWESDVDVLQALLAAAKDDYVGGFVFSMRALVKAEVLDDALTQAHVLLQADFKDPACVLVGVALEVAVKELAHQAGIPAAKLDKMNVELCRAGKYNMAKQKLITAWAELRNKAAHGDWNQYTKADVEDMHKGVERFVADHLR